MQSLHFLYNTKILTGIVCSIVILAATISPATAQTTNFNFKQTQYHYADLTQPALGMYISNPDIPRSFFNLFNKSKTQHLFGFLHSSTHSTSNTVRHYTHFVFANLGTKEQTISHINNVKARMEFPLLIDLPLKEAHYLSNRVCDLRRGAAYMSSHALIATHNCEKISHTSNIVIRPGQFLLKTYHTPSTVHTTSKTHFKPPLHKNLQSLTIKQNDIVVTTADIKVRGIGDPIQLKSMVSIGNIFIYPSEKPEWTHARTVNGTTISFSNHITPLQLLSSIQWLK